MLKHAHQHEGWLCLPLNQNTPSLLFAHFLCINNRFTGKVAVTGIGTQYNSNNQVLFSPVQSVFYIHEFFLVLWSSCDMHQSAIQKVLLTQHESIAAWDERCRRQTLEMLENSTLQIWALLTLLDTCPLCM